MIDLIKKDIYRCMLKCWITWLSSDEEFRFQSWIIRMNSSSTSGMSVLLFRGRTMIGPATPSVRMVPWWEWYQWVPRGSALYLSVAEIKREEQNKIFFFLQWNLFSDLYRNVIQKIFIIKMGELFLPLKFAHFYIFVYFYTDLF